MAVVEEPGERRCPAGEARSGGERIDEVLPDHARAVLCDVPEDVDEGVAHLARGAELATMPAIAPEQAPRTPTRRTAGTRGSCPPRGCANCSLNRPANDLLRPHATSRLLPSHEPDLHPRRPALPRAPPLLLRRRHGARGLQHHHGARDLHGGRRRPHVAHRPERRRVARRSAGPRPARVQAHLQRKGMRWRRMRRLLRYLQEQREVQHQQGHVLGDVHAFVHRPRMRKRRLRRLLRDLRYRHLQDRRMPVHTGQRLRSQPRLRPGHERQPRMLPRVRSVRRIDVHRRPAVQHLRGGRRRSPHRRLRSRPRGEDRE